MNNIATNNGSPAAPVEVTSDSPEAALWPDRPAPETPPSGRPRRGRPWVVGVRGGVGTSTIARAIGGRDRGVDLGWPPPDTTIVVVTSPAVSDTARLPALLERCHPGVIHPVVVAVVSDGHGRWPAATRARLRMIRDRVETVSVPWVARWRWHGVDDRTTAAWLRATAALARIAGADLHDTEPLATKSSPSGE